MRLTIVEDHGLMAQTLGLALAGEGHVVEVVDGAASSDLAADVLGTSPDVVLCDLDLGEGRDSMPAIAPVTAAGVPVLMVTGVTDPVRLARTVRAGAVGIVDKSAPFDELVDAVRRVARTGRLLDDHAREELLAVLRADEADAERRLAPFRELTPREGAVLGALAEGRTVDQIARADVVAVSTVRSQVKAILRKLGVNSQLAATAMAREVGWTG